MQLGRTTILHDPGCIVNVVGSPNAVHTVCTQALQGTFQKKNCLYVGKFITPLDVVQPRFPLEKYEIDFVEQRNNDTIMDAAMLEGQTQVGECS